SLAENVDMANPRRQATLFLEPKQPVSGEPLNAGILHRQLELGSIGTKVELWSPVDCPLQRWWLGLQHVAQAEEVCSQGTTARGKQVLPLVEPFPVGMVFFPTANPAVQE